ncbi:N-acetylmuramoyl-L-alanine amidase [Sinorhizobium sp. FG01]|nr:N-acetylmuramoyl-L-alanine amidase [Sinorhizobium sp. FG01]
MSRYDWAPVESSTADCGCRHTLSAFRVTDTVFHPIGAAEAAQPMIHGTASWNARPPRQSISLLNRRPTGIVIHHTASANVADGSLSHAKQLARNIQAFHMGQRGWIDTGQHFTISRGGHVLEGRHRSLEAARSGQRHVLGAHAENCNTEFVGIENEGTYIERLPTTAQWTALVQLCVWLCTQYSMSVDSIIGHRQCKSTECPGERFFGKLDRLRQDVSAAL